MENLLKGLLVVGGEIKMKSVSETASVELSGRFTIERGNFKQEFSYWARTYNKLDNHAKIDDYEYETQSASLGDLPIDNLNKLVQSLRDSGLDTLASKVGFSYEEIEQGMYQHIQNHKIFKGVYGESVILWDALTKEQQQLEYTKFAIKNFDDCQEWVKRECGVVGVDEEGNTIPNYVPTKEELQKRLEELSE